MSLLLSLDTSTKALSIALSDGDTLLWEHVSRGGGTATASLMPAIAWGMEQAGFEPQDLEAVAVGIGPGYLTSLRVGMVTAMTLAQTLKITLVAMNSLELTALSARPGLVLPCFDALKGQVHTGLYRVSAGETVEVRPPACQDPPALAAEIAALGEPFAIAGDGYARHHEALSLPAGCVAVPAHLWHPRPWALAARGRELLDAGQTADPLTLQPLYLRAPDAKPADIAPHPNLPKDLP